MGRFVSRDPYPEYQLMPVFGVNKGVVLESKVEKLIRLNKAYLISRLSSLYDFNDPLAYHTGMNLYKFYYSINALDPSGLMSSGSGRRGGRSRRNVRPGGGAFRIPGNNYGGMGWSGGDWNWEGDPDYDPDDPNNPDPTGAEDACYQGHDSCRNDIFRDRDSDDPCDTTGDDLDDCDDALVNCLDNLENPSLVSRTTSWLFRSGTASSRRASGL